MKTETFMDIIGAHYKDIKALFKSRLYNIDRKFDEDLFNDAFIKCATKFGNEVITYDLAIKYFWIAYLNTIKSVKTNKFEEIDEMLHDCIDEDDSSYANYIYNIVMDAISEAYGEEDAMLYSLYKYHGWSVDELIAEGYDCKNIEVRVNTIHKFVKAYCKKHCK